MTSDADDLLSDVIEAVHRRCVICEELLGHADFLECCGLLAADVQLTDGRTEQDALCQNDLHRRSTDAVQLRFEPAEVSDVVDSVAVLLVAYLDDVHDAP